MINISTVYDVETNSSYTLCNVLIQLDDILLGDINNFDLLGTVLLDFNDLAEKINLLDHASEHADILQKLDMQEYYCSIHDLLPRGSSLFDGDALFAFKNKNGFTAICQPYGQDRIIIEDFPIMVYLEKITNLINELENI